jgi:hypothetical protein
VSAVSPLARLRAERRLAVDLHPRIEARVRAQFLLGEVELAAFAAMREVEIHVRELSGAPDSLIGVKLMREAYGSNGPRRGEGRPMARTPAERMTRIVKTASKAWRSYASRGALVRALAFEAGTLWGTVDARCNPSWKARS